MLRPLEWIARLLLTGLMFVYFGVGSVLLSWVILPLRRMGAADDAERVRRTHAVVAAGYDQFHALMRWFRLLHFEPRKVNIPLPDGPCVIVANHPTLVDVTALSTVCRSHCTVVKSSLFRTFVVGPLLRYSWHIDAGEGDSMSGAAVIQGALERLAAGFNVMIFPEGTRSPPGSLRRFRRGAFEIACRAGVPVVPVFITCDPPTLMKGVPWYALPKRLARMEMEPMEVLRPEDFDKDAKRLAHHLQTIYRARIEAWRAARPDQLAPAADDAPSEG